MNKASNTATTFQNVRLIPLDGPIIEHGAICVQNGRIEALGSVDDVAAEGEIIDCAGMTAVPGLMDLHVHLTLPGDRSFADVVTMEPAALALHAAKNARKTLLSGVTTVRDAAGIKGVEVHLARALAEESIVGPRFYHCGKVITMTGGHAYFLAREADGTVEVRKATREQIKVGAHWIKLMGSGGFAVPEESPHAPQLDEEEMATAVAEGARAGRPSFAHAHPAESMKAGIAAGARSIEHASFPDAETIDMLLQNDVFIVPTFTVYEFMMKQGDVGGVPAPVVEMLKRSWDVKAEHFAKALDAGVKIATGTDTGFPAAPHGNLVREIELLTEMGMSNEQALRASTVDAAELMGLSDDAGTLTPGKWADIVIVDGNPLESIEALRKVKLVVKNGQVYRPGER